MAEVEQTTREFRAKILLHPNRLFSKMAGNGERNRSLKEALFESLTAILSPQHDVRVNGEEQIKALEVTEGTESFVIFQNLS